MINKRPEPRETESSLSKDDLEQVIVKRYRLRRKIKKDSRQEQDKL